MALSFLKAYLIMNVVTPTSTRSTVFRLTLGGNCKIHHAVQKAIDGDEVAISQLTEGEQAAATELLNEIFTKAKETLKTASKLRCLKKTVIFAKNVSVSDQLYVHPGFMQNGAFIATYQDKLGDLDIESVISAHTLLVAPLRFVFDPKNATTVEDVEITVESKNPNRPKVLNFQTGNSFILFNGHSIQACYNLHAIKSIKLSGVVRKREPSADDEVQPRKLKMEE